MRICAVVPVDLKAGDRANDFANLSVYIHLSFISTFFQKRIGIAEMLREVYK